MEYYRIFPENDSDTSKKELSPIEQYHLHFLPKDDCGAKIIGTFITHSEEDEAFLKDVIERSDAMVLTERPLTRNIQLVYVGFGSLNAEMIAKLTLVN